MDVTKWRKRLLDVALVVVSVLFVGMLAATAASYPSIQAEKCAARWPSYETQRVRGNVCLVYVNDVWVPERSVVVYVDDR